MVKPEDLNTSAIVIAGRWAIVGLTAASAVTGLEVGLVTAPNVMLSIKEYAVEWEKQRRSE